MIHMFVYGTLRKGEENHHFLLGAKLISQQCWIYGEMYDTGFGYPAIVEHPFQKVYGELYTITNEQLKLIDELEDYVEGRKDNLYERMTKKVYTDNGSCESLVYVAGKELIARGEWLELGDWNVYQRLKSKEYFYYFAYGSCMDHERFVKAGVDSLFQDMIGVGVLDGYTLRFTRKSDDGGKADIVEDRTDYVEGKIYKIHKSTLQYLFTREGVHAGVYRPTLVHPLYQGKSLPDVLTFVVITKEKETPPSTKYAEEIIRGGRDVLSEKYFRKLENHIHTLIENYE
ncbi:gamma-glutamylcyclotransferase [Ectobacillus sp. sgz5001026]|uniref:gamma-glutamylcyclotransferase n=1 Tax=Ectobacillus sp. sgz5001026 TaxID=3242473 RepID=UPI0036D26067